MENETRMQLSRKQMIGFELFQRPEVSLICYGGGAGSAKSSLVCFIAIYFCVQYPGIKFGMFRRTMTNMKRTLYPTLKETLDRFGMIPEVDYKDRIISGGFLDFKNDSRIEFADLDYRPSDPQFSALGGREYTFAAIDEAGEVVEAGFDVVRSRIGRCKNKEYGLPPKIILTCNPSSNFIRDRFYRPFEHSNDPHKAQGYALWPDGVYYDYKTGLEKPSYACFLQSTAYDNPFLDPNYIQNLQRLPEGERKRLLGGDWNFDSADNSLFPIELVTKATTYEMPEQEYIEKPSQIWGRPPEKVPMFKKFIGVDVADKGKDRTVVTLIDNNVVVAQETLNININSESPVSRLYADALTDFATRHGFTPNQSKNIWIEENGVGAGIRDMMRMKNWAIHAYTATAKARSQHYWDLHQDMDEGKVKLYSELSGMSELTRELGVHTYEFVDQVPKVCKKEEIKAQLGRSPDLADSLMIANAARHQGTNFGVSNRFKVASI